MLGYWLSLLIKTSGCFELVAKCLKMSSAKAKYAKKWRKERRQNRRLEILAMDYLLTKYPSIHAEIGLFYGKLNNKYPGKNNLTKTLEYRVWKTDQEMSTTMTAERQGTSTTTTTTAERQGTSTATTTTTVISTGQETSTTTTTAERQGTSTATTTTAEQQGTSTATTTTTVISTGQATSTPYDLNIEGDLDIEGPLLCDLDIDDMDAVITNIIADMEQDEDLRSLMNNFS